MQSPWIQDPVQVEEVSVRLTESPVCVREIPGIFLVKFTYSEFIAVKIPGKLFSNRFPEDLTTTYPFKSK